VTDKGIEAGIGIAREPYPHVGVGDPKVAYDYRRVEVDEALAGSGTLQACSVELDMDNKDPRRASYKLVSASGTDDDRALVKLEVLPGPKGRTYYELPRDTVSLAKGAFSRTAGGPQLEAPAELIVLRKDTDARVYQIEELGAPMRLTFTLSFDGRELRKK
jgi:hypothetical protein